jgi:hypothetical protein
MEPRLQPVPSIRRGAHDSAGGVHADRLTRHPSTAERHKPIGHSDGKIVAKGTMQAVVAIATRSDGQLSTIRSSRPLSEELESV